MNPLSVALYTIFLLLSMVLVIASGVYLLVKAFLPGFLFILALLLLWFMSALPKMNKPGGS